MHNTLRLTTAIKDRYRIEHELGAGGMATVYLAYDLKHGREVALKVLRPDLGAALGAERFLSEIRITSRLDHPHILTLMDSGAEEGFFYYVLPYVRGESLRARLDREHQLGIADAVGIATQIAGALDYAHRNGVVHRDVKPENILLHEGEAMLTDFGIALAVTEAGGSRLTGTGVAVGTPQYMSPEQAAGDRELDARSDIYSLAAVLYEMLAGEPPVNGPTAQAIVAKLLTERPTPLQVLRDTVPDGLNAAIATGLHRTPADRFATAAEFARALAPRAGALPAGRDGSTRPRLRSWRSVLIGSAVVGIVALSALLLGRRRTPTGPERLAVLPFQNLGDTADNYFADGMTDAVRGKLSALPTLRIIARTSSVQYAGTTKAPAQIGSELGVQYLLTGTVRWERSGAASRVEVRPELIDTRDGTTRWQAPFDATLSDVFTVQGEIAGDVAQALDIALGDSTRRELKAAPTQNTAAYDAYLRGEQLRQAQDLARAQTYYEQATALDPGFGLAWARLAFVRAVQLRATPTSDQMALTAQALDQARALAPDAAATFVAAGQFYYSTEDDAVKAGREFAAGLRIAPDDAELNSFRGLSLEAPGEWDSALVHLRRAESLDPRSLVIADWLGTAYLKTRRYPEARAALDHGLAVVPNNLPLLYDRVLLAAAQGDLPGARDVIRRAVATADPVSLVVFLGSSATSWVLPDSQQQVLLRLGPDAFDGDRAGWGLSRATAYWRQGNAPMARIYADSARIALEAGLRVAPNGPDQHVSLGLALAYLGRKAEAEQEGSRAMALRPISRDQYDGPALQAAAVRIHLIVGDPSGALDLLEPLLKVPCYLSPGWLRIDPTFASLRGNPRFEKLAAGG